MTSYPDLFAALAAPFETHEVKARTTAGKQLHYITARTAMNRLDQVLGPENWWDEYTANENSVLCRLTIRLPDGSTLTKADAGGYAGMADSGDDDKSGYSDAFKRAGVKFGIARYLYGDGVPGFVAAACATPAEARDHARANGNGNGNGKARGRDWPAASTPYGEPAGAAAASPVPPPDARNGNNPKTGKALFGWVKDMEQKHEVGLLKYVSQWAKLQNFPGRMVDWSDDQVVAAYAEARRKLASLEPA